MFRDLHCVEDRKKTKKEKENVLDKEFTDLLNDPSEIDDILASFSVSEIMKHVMDCISVLIRVEQKLKEIKAKGKLVRIEDEIKLMMANSKVFIAAVTVTIQELIGGNGNQDIATKHYLHAFPDKSKDS